MDKGSIIAEGAPWELCEGINGKVFEITAEEKDIRVQESIPGKDGKKDAESAWKTIKEKNH